MLTSNRALHKAELTLSRELIFVLIIVIIYIGKGTHAVKIIYILQLLKRLAIWLIV